jgi:hypothetical protein
MRPSARDESCCEYFTWQQIPQTSAGVTIESGHIMEREQPLDQRRRHRRRRLTVSREREGKQDNNSLSLTIMLPHLPIVSPPRCIIVTRSE